MDDTIIRVAVAGDAHRFVALWSTLQEEAEGLLFEAGSNHSPLANSDHRHRAKAGFAHILFLDDIRHATLAGFAAATRMPRDTATAEIIMAIKQTHIGRGWGYGLLQGIHEWAATSGIEQLSLAVAAGNRSALKLYRKFGFEIAHTNPKAVQTLTGLDDLHLMVKSLR